MLLGLLIAPGGRVMEPLKRAHVEALVLAHFATEGVAVQGGYRIHETMRSWVVTSGPSDDGVVLLSLDRWTGAAANSHGREPFQAAS